MGASPWWGLAVAASPGLLFSASGALTEPLQVALVCAALLVWGSPRAQPGLLAGLLVACCLTKEQLVLVPAAMALDALMTRRQSGAGTWAALAAGPAALLGWLIWVRAVMSPAELAYQDGNIGLPFTQLRGVLQLCALLRQQDDHGAQTGTTAPSLLVATAVLLLCGTVAGLLRRDALGLVVAAFTLLTTCLGWRTLVFPHEGLRIPAVAVVLALLSLAAGTVRPAAQDQSS